MSRMSDGRKYDRIIGKCWHFKRILLAPVRHPINFNGISYNYRLNASSGPFIELSKVSFLNCPLEFELSYVYAEVRHALYKIDKKFT